MIVRNLIFLACTLSILMTGSSAKGADSLESAMKEVAASLGPSLSESGLKKLAVVEFTDLNGYRSALGPFLAEELTTQLFEAKPGAFDFVERQQLAKVLAEQKLTSSSLFEAGSIASVGKVLGIQAIVTGSIADLGEEIKVNTRVISVESARIVAAASAKFPRKGSVETLLRQTGGVGPPGAGLPAKQTQTSDVYFANKLLQITVDSISMNSDKDQIHLVLAIENTTSEDLSLSLKSSDASLTASSGESYGCTSVTGFGSNGFWGWTVFSPHSRTIISLSFSPSLFENPKKQMSPGFYSFSASMNRLVDKDAVSFSVGISGIRLQDS